MTKVRQDAWSHEDDLLLAETVLRHIRDGSTQLNAFEEVGDELNRTSAACGFRWNAEVRNKYIQAIELAKKQRKQKKRMQAANRKQIKNEKTFELQENLTSEQNNKLIMEPEEVAHSEVELNLEKVIHYLEKLSQDMYHSEHNKQKFDKLESENQALYERVQELERELQVKEKRLETVEEDYRTFIQIMERARKMTVLEDTHSEQAPAFKMDKNGNLEQVVRSHTN